MRILVFKDFSTRLSSHTSHAWLHSYIGILPGVNKSDLCMLPSVLLMNTINVSWETHLLTSEGMDKQREDEIAGHKEHRGRGNGEDLWRRQRKGGSLNFMAHLSLFRRCSNDATHSHKNILSWLWFSHATCMWITAALIVLPLFDSRFGATQSDVYVAKCILEQQLMKSCFGKNWV